MKIRVGFVSNSSSASFIIKFKADEKISKEDITKYIVSSSKHFSHPESKERSQDIIQIDNCVQLRYDSAKKMYLFATFTDMFNDWTEVPGYNFIRALNEKRIDGIKITKIIQTEDDMDSINSPIKFNPYTWKHKEIEKNKDKSCPDDQPSIDGAYFVYLQKIRVNTTDDEKVLAAKFVLNDTK